MDSNNVLMSLPTIAVYNAHYDAQGQAIANTPIHTDFLFTVGFQTNTMRKISNDTFVDILCTAELMTKEKDLESPKGISSKFYCLNPQWKVQTVNPREFIDVTQVSSNATDPVVRIIFLEAMNESHLSQLSLKLLPSPNRNIVVIPNSDAGDKINLQHFMQGYQLVTSNNSTSIGPFKYLFLETFVPPPQPILTLQPSGVPATVNPISPPVPISESLPLPTPAVRQSRSGCARLLQKIGKIFKAFLALFFCC